ncbi:hypothetical protein DSO57_1021496 [Entomophthora muscae]|uniref:Uncharacterized protein n=1 Tax=Entomophthora muscae TaxID=34485 RepID=A0ACC2RI59_9FUNG|nr:hypothetical protein DSO57_1021496 [Entomophthora muscae]
MKTGRQSQASYQNSSGQEYHSLDKVVTKNGGPPVVNIEETVQYLETQGEEAHKAVFKAQFFASKVNHNQHASPSQQAAPVATAPHNTLPFFKPVNLPRFDRKSNVAMFLWLYQNLMYGADEAMKDTTIINCLVTKTQRLILPCISENSWTYANISWALMEEFGSQEALLGQEMDFADTKLKVVETLKDFSYIS